jgi:SAM-dependent methyltransferase
MHIAYAPSRLHWFITRAIEKIPPIDRYYKRKQTEKICELAERAANRNFSVRVLDSGWATQSRLTVEHYKILTRELVKIDKMTGAVFMGCIPPALLWSRRYEYPYAIINGIPSGYPSKDFKILDCGSGAGPCQFYLAMKGYKVFSVDLDLSALELVARFKSKNRVKTLYPTYGNILDLPFPSNYFDRVLCISVLEHIIYHLKQDTDVILRGFVNELLRILKPKGLVVLTFDVNMNPQKSDHRLYYHEYESLCEILGISSTRAPKDRLCSSDSEEGRMMGEDLCVYCATLTRNSLV